MLRSRAFLSLNLAHFFDHFVLMILPTAALATGADYAERSARPTWAFAAFAVATLPAGWLGDRLGRVAMMRLYWFGTGAACLLAGLAPGPWSLAAGLGLIGAVRRDLPSRRDRDGDGLPGAEPGTHSPSTACGAIWGSPPPRS